MNDQAKPLDYYKDWTAYEALKEAVQQSSWLSVWNLLRCACCRAPHCWRNTSVCSVSPHLKARIRWYDHVLLNDEAQLEQTWPNLRPLQAHFVGHHQRIELILLCMWPALDDIYTKLKPYSERNQWDRLSLDFASEIEAQCIWVADGWTAVAELMRGVAKMNRIQYLRYVPRLAGVSGGNSPTMMPLTARTVKLESLLVSVSDECISDALSKQTPLGVVALAFMDCLDAISRCWFDHVVTATTTIGITSGTKGTPNVTLVDRVLHRLHHARLLHLLGALRKPMAGLGTEMRQLNDYALYPLADHYLDFFDDPGPEFGSHNIGWLPKVYDQARAEFAVIRRSSRSKLWAYFYEHVRPDFCSALSQLLGVNQGNADHTVQFGLGSSVTEVLSRITSSLLTMNQANSLTVVLPDHEFVTMQRCAAILGRQGALLKRVSIDEIAEQAVNIVCNDNSKQVERVVMFSLVNSCTQHVVDNLAWISNVPRHVVVIVDITQAVGNLPLELESIAGLANVFIVGSLVKHARCGEGLGFLTYLGRDEAIVSNPASGWTAYLSGLRENRTVDAQDQLLYDGGLEWEGGTPSWVESAFVATRILQQLPTVKVQHDYVKQLQQTFLEAVDLSQEQKLFVSESNTLAIPVLKAVDKPLFGLDYKVVNDTTILRIGFGVHCLKYHLTELIYYVNENKLLEH